MAKFSIFEEVKPPCVFTPAVTLPVLKHPDLQPNSGSWCVLELQSLREEGGRTYRVARYWKDDVGAEVWPVL